MEWMTLPNFVGLIGVSIILTMYIRLQIGCASHLDFSYSLYNFIGAVAILFSLMYSWNLSSVIIECIWIVASVIGMVKALRRGVSNA